ncbi:MAG: type VI secretion system contractile sheath small subunit [Acidobacteria bacterium]|nr:type VI secretion system contractile sheath small subunit [Acidobacteriota bacterium]
MPESTQHKLDRVRPPRVQITYDVETGGAIEKKELPLVIGVLADLSGKPAKPLPKLKDRKFVEIDRDNIDKVMASVTPRIAVRAADKLSKDGGFLNVELKFSKMEDFEPVSVVNQVPALKKLFEARGRLSDLLAKLDGNDELDSRLQEIVANTEALQEIKTVVEKAAAEKAAKEKAAKEKAEKEGVTNA